MFAAAKYAFISFAVAGLPLFGSVGTTISALICGSPAAPTIAQPADGSSTTNSSVVVSGLAEANSTVQVFRNTNLAGTVLSAADGSWSVGVALVVGSNALYAQSNTGCGTSPQSNQVNVTRSENPPPPPAISSPSNGSTTTDSSVIVSGSAEANSVVTVYRGTAQIGSVTASNTGNYSLTVPLVVGVNNLKAAATNASGTSGYSSTVTVTRTVAAQPPNGGSGPVSPRPPVSGGVIILSPSDGSSTDRAAIIVSGTAPSGNRVTIKSNGTVKAEVISDQYGAFSASIPLDLGVNIIDASIPNGSSAVVRVTRTSSPPSIPIITMPTQGQTVNDDFLVVRGKSNPGVEVVVSVNGLEVGKVFADSEGNFSLGVTLKPGRNVIIATARNEAGSSQSSPTEVTYNSSALASPGTAAKDGGVGILSTLAAGIIGLPLLVQDGLTQNVFPHIALPLAATIFLLIGLALAIMLRGPSGLLELASLFFLWPHRKRVKVINAITGKPVAWPVIHINSGTITVSKKGFQTEKAPLATDGTAIISLEPLPPQHSLAGHLMRDGLWLFALGFIIVSIDYAFYLALSGQPLALFGLPILAVTIAQIRLAASGAHIHWGRISGSGVAFGPGSQVQVYTGVSSLQSTRPVTPEGYFAIYESPGTYTLKPQIPGWNFEPIQVAKSKAGFVTAHINGGTLAGIPNTFNPK